MCTDNNTYQRKTQKRNRAINGTPMYSVQNKHIGYVIGNEWQKEIRNSHMLKVPPAIANDTQALHDAIRAGAEYVVITNTENGIVYRASISKIFDKGVQMNRGYGNQIYLVLSDWLQSCDSEFTPTETSAYSEPTATDDAEPLKYTSHAPKGVTFTKGKQMSLFGEGE